MKRIIMPIILVVAICLILFSKSILQVMADESTSPTMHRYYKSIPIEAGDSLWSIAKTYAPQGNIETKHYIKEIKKMNNLTEDTIQTGQYLTVVYFVPDY